MNRSAPLKSDQPLGGRYNVLTQLGVGGFGRTFLAEDLHLPGNPCCVVKQLKPQITSDDTLQTARRCFNTEAEVLYQLGSHEQIPRLLAHFEDNHEFYLALEFVEGEPLTQELLDGKPWAELRVVTLLKDVLEILTFVHSQQVIHRDLKPSNLIRRKHDGKIVLIDFGAVKQVSTQSVDRELGLTTITISIGTQGYMPNEQLAGRPRFSSDIYALGIIGIQALTGTHPKYFGEDAEGEVDWFYRAAKTSPALVEVLNRMVRYDFRERYQSAEAVITALEPIATHLTQEASLAQAVDSSEPLVLSTTDSSDIGAEPYVVPDTIAETIPTHVEAIAIADVLTVDQSEASSSHPDLSGQPDDQGQEAAAHRVTTGQKGAMSTTLHLPPDSLSPDPLPSDPLPSDPPPQPGSNHPVSDPTGMTQAVGRPSLPPGDTTIVVRSKPSTPRWLIQLCSILAIGSVAGATFSIVRFLPEFLGETTPNPTDGSVGEPSPMVTPTASPGSVADSSPTPISPSQQAAELVKQGDRLLHDRLYPEALKIYDRAIALKSDFAEAHAGRCEALNRLRQPEEAIVSCDDALAYKPRYPQALWSKGNALLLLQNRTMEALRLYEEVTRLKADFAPGWAKRGIALQRLGRSAEALTMLDRSIGLERNSAEAWIARGQALTNLGRYNHAIASLDKALQLEPNNADAQKLRQQLRDKLGR
jgi:eukaryotic-like serine/threonine-protein kinase